MRSRRHHRETLLVASILFSLCLPLQMQAQDAILELMNDEMAREMEILKTQDPPAYFLSYRINDMRNSSVEASLGAVTHSGEKVSRMLTVQLRVGDYKMDNTRELRGNEAFNFTMPQMNAMPIEDDPTSIRMLLWNATDRQYRQVAKRYEKVRANTAVKVEAEDKSADFSKLTSVEKYQDAPVEASTYMPDRKEWELRLKRISAEFLACESIFKGSASLKVAVERKRIATSEGAAIAENRISARLMLRATVKCDDGMELPLHRSYFAYDLTGLPDEARLMADVKEMVATLQSMKDAPVIEPFTGPALLSGRSSGVFFHEIFGHRVEGHRQKQESEGQTFKKKIDEQVLPEHMSVVFDPAKRSFNGTDLNGYYRFDDEGVAGAKVEIVENGILRGFLMNRTPFENFGTSNGHGRAATGYQPVSRQSNLIVSTTDPKSDDELRELLIEECERQGKDFGLYIKDVQGGFTMTGRFIPNAFNVTPTEVYRVYVDGRPDELVRGVDLVGTPLVMFSNITDAGTDTDIFTGTCGAESGGIPVTAMSPAVLVSQIEVQKKSKSQERAPILSRPDKDTNTRQSGKKTF